MTSLAALADTVLKEIQGEKEKTTRARCEENWAELVVAVVFADDSVNTKADVLAHAYTEDHEGYAEDLLKRSEKKVNAYIANLKSEKKKMNIEVDQVLILGKNQDLTPEITRLQKGLDRKEKKSDVMILLTDGRYIGISVKSGKGDTLTNYAIEKFLPNGKQLKQLRMDMIKDANLPLRMDKARRSEYNDLFRGENTYHTELTASVMENADTVLQQWVRGLFAETPFEIFSFDGEEIRPNTYSQVKDIQFTVRPIPNPAKRARNAAKVFFEVSIEGSPAYIWDVRWKGSVTASPQIFTYRIK